MNPGPTDPATSWSRRSFLRLGVLWAPAVAGTVPLSGCERTEPFDGIEVELARLPQGRTTLWHHGLPVEVERRDDAVRARSLLCTHQGCELQWRAAENHYFCPCHEGIFDAEGRPQSGPPREPLRSMPVEVQSGRVRISTRVPEGE